MMLSRLLSELHDADADVGAGHGVALRVHDDRTRMVPRGMRLSGSKRSRAEGVRPLARRTTCGRHLRLLLLRCLRLLWLAASGRTLEAALLLGLLTRLARAVDDVRRSGRLIAGLGDARWTRRGRASVIEALHSSSLPALAALASSLSNE